MSLSGIQLLYGYERERDHLALALHQRTITSYFGDVNPNIDKEVRPVMDALKKVFGDCKATFVGIIHHNKRNDAVAIQKVLGASSVAGAVRAA
jgi:hypothetical protein